ncbi:MAG TPA: DegQ family serine endoprotease [Stellaceae bacterium]|jgi:serine protease Do|nr:DegQ family serine endoprotease [Stellaceae bacterium]
MAARCFFLAWVLIVAALAPGLAQNRTPPTSRELIHLSFAPVVKKVAPAVVNVYSRRTVQTRSPFLDDPLFRRFFGDQAPFGLPRERVQQSLGSGVILGADGLIVTNHHVIDGAEQITVVLSDRREFEAKVVLSDEHADLAVLKIDTHGERLPVLELGDSDQLEVGDLVLAIGDPFGVGQTVTSGIISALARTGIGSDVSSFIQTDAAINPGNSGGALVDLDGKLVGINTAIFSQSGGSIGIGFAIPTTLVRTVLQAAASGGTIRHPWFGATGQEVTAEIAAALHLPRPGGVLVKDVVADGPAARGGIRIGDVITAIGGHDVEDPDDLRYRIAILPIDTPTPITLWRNGQSIAATVVLTALPDTPARQVTALSTGTPLAGATVANLNPAQADELGLATTARGVAVLSAKSGSLADRLGLQQGDIIATVNRNPVASVDELKDAVGAGPGPWTFGIRRGGQLFAVSVR